MIFDDIKSFVLSHSSEHLSTPGALRALQGDFATSADRTAHFRKDRLHPQCVSFPLCSSKCYPTTPVTCQVGRREGAEGQALRAPADDTGFLSIPELLGIENLEHTLGFPCRGSNLNPSISSTRTQDTAAASLGVSRAFKRGAGS